MSKVLVCGSRWFGDYGILCNLLDALLKNYKDLELVSGGSIGADKLAEAYAQEHNIPIKVFYADWDHFGKKAGYLRNDAMHKYILKDKDRLCVAFWDGKSPGTQHNFGLAAMNETNLCVYNHLTRTVKYIVGKTGETRTFSYGVKTGTQG